MSRTALKRITPEGLVVEVTEYSNAHGFAPYIWSALSRRYFGNPAHWLIGSMRESNGLKPFWDLYKRPDLPLHWRTTFASTFDRVLIEATHLPLLASHLVLFERDFRDPEVVCHLPQISADLLALPPGLGAAFYGTSVTEDPWVYRSDSETDDPSYEPYDIHKGEKHFFLFAELDKLGVLS